MGESIMSELTKFIAQIAIITLEKISNALLETASEIRKLPHSPADTLSQAQDKFSFANQEREFTKRDKYKLRDRVIVNLNPPHYPSKMTISEILEGNEYMAYHWQRSKDTAQKINHSQILGLDPNR
jgi:hypothetical protein